MTLYNKCEWFRNGVNAAFGGIKSFIAGVVDSIKGFLSFEWKLPKIKLPHFKIKGGFSLTPPKTPKFSVDWYMISGEGACVLTVNGKTMTADVRQNITIDTDRELAYRKDKTLSNTAVSGKYDDLYLQEGENEITITEGFDLKIIPNWRCL